jgi:AsmA family protein
MRWKWIILGICGLIVALIIAAVVILSTYNFNSLKPQITKAAKEATGRELTLGGDIRLKISLTPALVVENVSFQNAPWGSRPEMAKIKRFEVRVALLPLLSKTIQLKRMILVEPDILIETDKSGRSNLAFGTEKKAIPEKPKEEPPAKKGMKMPSLAVDEFRIEKAKVTYRDDRTGKTMVVSLESLTASAKGTESPIQLKLKGAYNAEPFEAEGVLGSLAGLTGPGNPWPIKVTAKAFGTTLTLDGTIKDVQAQSGIDLGFGVKGSDLATLGKASGKPLRLKGPFDVSGRVSDPAPKTYRVSNLKVALGGSDLAGTVEVRMAGQKPALMANLSSQKLDIRSMMPEAASSGTEKTAEKASKESSKTAQTRERLLPNDPLPLEALGQADAKVKFQAGQLLLPMITLTDVSVDMNLLDGRLAINPFKAGMSGGKLNAQLDLQAQGKVAVLSAVMNVEGVGLGPLLKEVRKIEGIEGRLDADLNLKGRGGSVAAIMGGLDGKSVITMKEGKIDNTYLDLLAGDLKGILFNLLGLSPQDSKFTAINCFVSGFNIKEGRADTTALVIDTDQMNVIGEGEIDLKTEKLNLAFVPSLKGGSGSRRTDRVKASLSELAGNFRLGGTLANPSLGMDTTQSATSLDKVISGFLAGRKGASPTPPAETQADEPLCPKAMEAARKGVKMSSAVKQQKKETSVPGQAPSPGMKDLGKEFQKLFKK